MQRPRAFGFFCFDFSFSTQASTNRPKVRPALRLDLHVLDPHQRHSRHRFLLGIFFYVLGTLLVIIPSPLLTKPLAIAPRSAPPRPESAKAAVPRTSSKRKATAVDSMGTDSCKQYLRDNNINFGRTRALAKLRALVKQHQNSLEPAKKKTKRG
jgi:hypothetical protein